MSQPRQGFHINVARNYNGELQWPPSAGKLRYLYFVSIFIGYIIRDDEARLFLEDTRKRYPAPEFECTMTEWKAIGRQIS